MARSQFHLSTILFAAVLSPAMLQQVDCNRSGNANLASIEIEAAGLNRVVGFSASTTSYDVWTTAGVNTIVVRAQTEAPSARVNYRLNIGGSITSGLVGTGGGEVTLTIPTTGSANLQLDVSDGGTRKLYIIDINPPCGVGECNDADDCTTDVCNTSNLTCEFTPTCSAGVTATIPMTCGNDLGIFGVPGPSEFELTVEPLSPVAAGQPFDAQMSGYAGMPELTLDATGGIADLVPLRAAVVGGSVPVVVRSGASDPNVSLLPAPTPGSYTCAVDASGNFGPGAGPFPSCDPANDLTYLEDPATGLFANSDCVGLGGMEDPTNPCAPFVELEIIDGTGDGCAACTALSATKGTVCQTTGFCSTVADPYAFPLTTETGAYVPDTGDAVLLGFSPYVDWYATDPFGSPVNVPDPGDGLQVIAQYGGFTPTGLLAIQIECVMDNVPDSGLVAIESTPSWIGAERVSSAPGWQGPELLETSAGDAIDARVAVTPYGDAVAVWAEGADVYANRLISGVWSGPELVQTGAGLVIEPKVDVDDNGDAVVVWEELDAAPSYEVYAVRLTSGTWGTVQTPGQLGVDKNDPEVAVASNGDAIVAWQQSDNDIVAVRLTSGTWGLPEKLETSGYQRRPQVAIAPSGDAVVVWEQFAGGVDWDIYASRFASGAWGPPEELADDLEQSTGVYLDYNHHCDSCIEFGAGQAFECGETGGCSFVNSRAPQVSVDASGDFVAIWKHDTTEIYTNRLTSIWGPAEAIATGPNEVFDPRLEIGPTDDAVVVWAQDNGTGTDVYASRRTAGVWGTPGPIEADAGSASDPQVAVDSTGHAVAAWAQDDGTATSIYRSRSTSGPWSAPELVETGTGASSNPHVAVDTNGDAVIVWQQDGATASDVYANRFNDLGDASQPRVAVDPSGDAIVVWEQFDGSTDNIYANRLISEAWAVPALLETAPGEAHNPEVAVDANGVALAVWAQLDGGLYTLAGNKLAPSSIWQSFEFGWSGALLPFSPNADFGPAGEAIVVWGQDDLAEDNIFALVTPVPSGSLSGADVLASDGVFNPQVAVSPHFNYEAVVVWEALDGVYASRLTSGVWGTPVLLGGASSTVFDVKVGMDANGDAVAGWLQFSGVDYSVYASRLTSGVWGTAELLWTGTEVPFDAQASVSANGDAVVVWAQDDGTASSIYASRLTSGVWGAAELLETDAGHASAPHVAMDANSDAVAVWQQEGASSTDIYANRLSSGSWSGPTLIEMQPGNARVPRVSLDDNGRVVVVWEQDDGTTTQIYGNRFE